VLNHAAIPVPDEPIWEMSVERWRNTIDTNVTGSFVVAKEYVRRLRGASDGVKDNASVLIVGSTAGKYGLGF
jgi:NAD(P)-dependent dehydrogenase (short-subunit alcohol dehydrogenase family)